MKIALNSQISFTVPLGSANQTQGKAGSLPVSESQPALSDLPSTNIR